MGQTRAHVELREMNTDELERFRVALTEAAGRMAQVKWVEVNPHTRRAVIEIERGAHELDQLVELVEGAERSAHVDKAAFPETAAEHPADTEPLQRLGLGAALDVLGLGIGTALKFSPFPSSGIAASIAAAATVVRASPRLRGGIDQALGQRRADLSLGGVISVAQGLAQRPMASFVDLAHRAALLREGRVRKETWEAREAELCSAPFEHDLRRASVDPRPVPLPRGPIEEYADRAWVVSLGGFAVSFLTTRSVQNAVAALFGALPKPARLGRDVFAAELGRALAARRVLVTDPDVLRRLDRIDCLVIQGDLVARDRFEVTDVVTLEGISRKDTRQRVLELFDPEQPVRVVRQANYALGPPGRLDAGMSIELEERAREVAARGELCLGLAHDGRIEGIVALSMIPQTGVEELITAAHEAQMRVVIASNDEAALQGLNVDDAIPSGDGLPSGIRRLQREGRSVMLVATGRAVGIGAADCAVGLVRAGETPPWAAHMISRDDLSDVRFVLSACVAARKVAKQSVNLALGAAGVGTLVAAGGVVSMTTRRVFTVVNAASLMAMANGARVSAVLERRALPPPRDRTPWYALDAQGVLAKLGSTEAGLSKSEAHSRRRPTLKDKPALLELSEAVTDELFNPLAPLLAAGAALSAVAGSVADAGMVGGVVGLNALVGGVQRFRTERAIRRLASDTTRRARVRRGGQVLEIDASDLARGDVILLSPGDVVQADCRIVSAESLEVDASSLTGESLPVRKGVTASFEPNVADRGSMLYEGTSIAAGKATAVVVATGDETEARRGANTARHDIATSGVEVRLRSLINMTGPIALGAGAALITTGVLRGRRLKDVVSSGVSLAVASVPEGLPLLATAAQLAAAERLSKRGALVRNAHNIEALGRVDVLCVDKTGTITEGRIELRRVCDGTADEAIDALSPSHLLVLAASLRATPELEHSAAFDPLDLALHRAASGYTLRAEYGAAGWRRVGELSFEAGRGYHAVTGQAAHQRYLDVKGAPEVILPACTRRLQGASRVALDEVTRARLVERAAELGRRGLRVLCVAERVVGEEDRLDPARLVGLSFVGFIAFSDPVRRTARAALEQLKTAGVETVMITGDHPSTAEAVARELDLMADKRVMTGAELAALTEEELDAVIGRVSVFARLTPSQKVRIVRAFQRAGRCVAMVGDGSNDAPAIRLANVGIAMGERSTSAARGAADVVITDERIETIVDAIVEGRAMWASVRDAVSILIGGNLGEIGFSVAAGLIDGRSPLNARQLLLVNMLTDVAPAMAIALRPPTKETLESLANEGPDASLGDALSRGIASRAIVTTAGAGAAFLIGRFTGTRERAATIGLLALVGTQLGQTVTSGGMSRPVLLTSALSAAVLAGIVQTPGLSQLFGCRPVGPVGWATAIGASALATAGATQYPELIQKVAERLRIVQMLPDDPFASPKLGAPVASQS
ncbi:MAG: HAD-IC family P-type ATPase [Myxococcales bacterium]|nr:HAD-IC family P-type ATPase [Myxococcales bacterium]